MCSSLMFEIKSFVSLKMTPFYVGPEYISRDGVKFSKILRRLEHKGGGGGSDRGSFLIKRMG